MILNNTSNLKVAITEMYPRIHFRDGSAEHTLGTTGLGDSEPVGAVT
jgi:hypothetical protein